MRVIFESAPTPASSKLPPTDKVVEGTAQFQAILYEPGETPNPDARPMSYWRSSLGPGQTLRVPVPARLIGMPEPVIPGSILAPLRDDAQLHLSWTWTRKGGPR